MATIIPKVQINDAGRMREIAIADNQLKEWSLLEGKFTGSLNIETSVVDHKSMNKEISQPKGFTVEPSARAVGVNAMKSVVSANLELHTSERTENANVRVEAHSITLINRIPARPLSPGQIQPGEPTAA